MHQMRHEKQQTEIFWVWGLFDPERETVQMLKEKSERASAIDPANSVWELFMLHFCQHSTAITAHNQLQHV